jgi:ATP-dependent RNA helicase TDRD9
VILATNIAESSITVADVRYIVDFGLTKEVFYDPHTKYESLELTWTSRASADQRRGRAGRAQKGDVFRLYPQKFFFEEMEEYARPEMQRSPLEQLLLQVKLLSPFGSPKKILEQSLQPPKMSAIDASLKSLQLVGAIGLPTERCADGEVYVGWFLRVWCVCVCMCVFLRLCEYVSPCELVFVRLCVVCV